MRLALTVVLAVLHIQASLQASRQSSLQISWSAQVSRDLSVETPPCWHACLPIKFDPAFHIGWGRVADGWVVSIVRGFVVALRTSGGTACISTLVGKVA